MRAELWETVKARHWPCGPNNLGVINSFIHMPATSANMPMFPEAGLLPSPASPERSPGIAALARSRGSASAT